jgi:hypothetical protein
LDVADNVSVFVISAEPVGMSGKNNSRFPSGMTERKTKATTRAKAEPGAWGVAGMGYVATIYVCVIG